jgi:hypothetical protein
MKPKLSKESAEVAYERSEGDCVNCLDPATSYHHIFYQTRWPELVDDPDNVIALCDWCHANHHAASHRLPRSVCGLAEALATTEAMEDWLDRIYGVREALRGPTSC